MPLDMLPPPITVAGEPREQDHQVSRSPVRLLTPEEVASLEPVFAKEGGSMPPPEHSFFLGSVAPDGHVVAFLVVQLRVHAEPVWVEKGHESVVMSLVHAAEQTIAEKVPGGCDVFLFAPAGRVSTLVAKAGMRLEPWAVWSKHVEGVMPDQDEREPDPEPVESVQ